MQKINWLYQFKQYSTAVLPALIIFGFLSIYLFFRRGYYDLYIANKVFAGTAAILLGIVLLIGPLSRSFSYPDRLLQYRKELGIIAFFLALIHGISSFFLLPDKFPTQQFFGSGLWPFVFGLTAIIILTGLFLISNSKAMAVFNGKLWWQLQSWGLRLGFTFIFLHVFVMKWSGWVKWYQVGGSKELVHPEWPGAGLLVGWFMAVVVLVRLAECGGPRLGRAIWQVSVVALPIIYVVTFWWGRQLIYGSD
ncbi:MAG: hypothetical protein U0946_00540 [Patescibacteria group bacterium]|nr:hypothetical protein [Patescibacteria group bacterium]